MPFLIPLIPALAALTGAAAIAATVALTVLEMAAMMLVSKLLAPSNHQGTQLSDGVTQEYSGTVEPRRIVYGLNLIAGMNAIPPWCHGTNNQMLDQVLVLAGHEVTAITDIWFNQELIPSASIAPINRTLNDGLVSTGTYANKAWIRRYTGAPAEAADYILLMAWVGVWDGYHTGTGLAKVCLQFQYDTTTYSGGKPEIRCLVKGKKCYDPRLDVSPGANPFNPSYMAYTANPALCTVDYLIDPKLGVGEDPARIDWTMAIAAANCCDELVQVPLLRSLVQPYGADTHYPVGAQALYLDVVYDCLVASFNVLPTVTANWAPVAGGTMTQPRYTCNSVLDCTATYEDNIKSLAGSMQGAVLYSSGKWVLYPGQWQTPSFVLGDDDISGAMDFATATPYQNRYNAVRGQFYDPANLYAPSEYPPITVDADEIEDGEGPVWQELQQPTCIDIFEAQRNAIIFQRQSRRKKTWAFPAGYSTFGIRPGDFGTISITELGIVDQYVKCTGWKLDGKAMNLAQTFVEVSPADWYDPATVVYQTNDNLLTPAGATFISDPVSALSGWGGSGGITFKWTMPPIWHSNLSVELLESDFNNLAEALVIWSGVNTGVFIQKSDVVVRYYWVQVRNFAGNTVSAPNPLTFTGGLAVGAITLGIGPQGPPGPAGPEGPTGSAALVGSVSLPSLVLPATAFGVVTSYAAATGKFVVYLGTTDVSGLCTYGLAPDGNLSGLGYTLSGVAVATRTWDSSITFDTGAGQTWDGGNSASVQGVPGGATYAITGGMPDDADTATLTLRATYLGKTVDQTLFIGKAKTGSVGAQGDPGVVMSITRTAMMVMCYAEGTPVDPTFTGIDGVLTVKHGPDDVTADCTVSAVMVGCVGTINVGANVPVAAHPMGYYRATAMAADTATMTLYALYKGWTYAAVVSLAKAKGGYEIVAALPTANLFIGRMVFLTTDQKLYRYTSTGWTTAVNAFDITGVLADAQIASLAASKITGQMTDAQLAGIAAAKIAGQLTDSQLAGLSAAKVTGTLTDAQLAGMAAAKLTGQIVKTQIGDSQIDTPQLATGAVKAGILYAGAVLTGDISAGAVIAGCIDTGAVRAGNIYGGAVVAGNIATDGVIAGNIHAGAVVAATIAAGQIQTLHMVANTIDGDRIQVNSLDAGKITANTITANQLSLGVLITASAQINTGVILSANIGNLQVKTANIDNLTVGTGQIGYNQVSRLATAVIASEVNAAGLVLSLDYTPDTPSPIKLDWTLNNRTSVNAGVTFTIRRFQSGVETQLATQQTIDNTTYQAYGTAYVSSGGTVIDNVGNTTARTYRVYQTGGVILPTSSMVVQEIKR